MLYVLSLLTMNWNVLDTDKSNWYDWYVNIGDCYMYCYFFVEHKQFSQFYHVVEQDEKHKRQKSMFKSSFSHNKFTQITY